MKHPEAWDRAGVLVPRASGEHIVTRGEPHNLPAAGARCGSPSATTRSTRRLADSPAPALTVRCGEPEYW